MKEDSISLLTSFDNMAEAEVAKSALEAHGLWCSIQNRNITGMNILEQNVFGGIRLVVRSEDLDEAKNVIDINNIEKDDAHGLENVEPVTKSRRKWIAAFLTLLVIVGTFVLLIFF